MLSRLVTHSCRGLLSHSAKNVALFQQTVTHSCRGLSLSAKNVAQQKNLNPRRRRDVNELPPSVLELFLLGTCGIGLVGFVVYKEWTMLQDPALARDRKLMMLGNLATGVGFCVFEIALRIRFMPLAKVIQEKRISGLPTIGLQLAQVAILIATGCIVRSIPDENTKSEYAGWLALMGVGGWVLTSTLPMIAFTRFRPLLMNWPWIGCAIGLSMSPCDYLLALSISLGRTFYHNTTTFNNFLSSNTPRSLLKKGWLVLFIGLIIAPQQGKTTKHPQKKQGGDHGNYGAEIKSIDTEYEFDV